MTPIRHTMQTDTVECAGIALVNGGRVFLIRPYYDFIPQSLAIPKGHVENGESAQKCALREFREETGIDLGDDTGILEYLTYVKTYIGKRSTKKVIVYVVKGSGEERFIGSIKSDSGSPENLYGEYIDFDTAEEYITPYQRGIIWALKKREMKSFETFLGDRI